MDYYRKVTINISDHFQGLDFFFRLNVTKFWFLLFFLLFLFVREVSLHRQALTSQRSASPHPTLWRDFISFL